MSYCSLIIACSLLLLPLPIACSDQPSPGQAGDILPLQPVPASLESPPPTAPPQGLLSLPHAHTGDLAPTSRTLRTIKAYYVGYAEDSFEAVRRHIPAVDIVAGQWLAVDANGDIREAPDVARNDEVRHLVHAAGRKVYTCVINKDFSRAALTSILQSPERRTIVIDRILSFIDKKGDDGIDLDFEGIRPEHRDCYNAFVKELSEKLHARGKELSIALDVTFGGAPSPGIDYDFLARCADTLMPMTYTFGPGPAPHSPIEYLEAATRLALRSVAPHKFMIGIGVYGRDYNLKTGRRVHPNARALQALLAKYSPKVSRDPNTLTKRFSYKDDNGHEHAVFFDDPETIQSKLTRLMDRHQIQAVGFWRMGQEDPTLWDFIQVASGKRPAPAPGDVSLLTQTAEDGPAR